MEANKDQEKAKAPKVDQNDATDNNESAGLTEKILKEKGKESSKNIRKGEPNVTVKLNRGSRVRAEFIKDVGKHIKKGHTQFLSELAYDAYDRIKAVKKI